MSISQTFATSLIHVPLVLTGSLALTAPAADAVTSRSTVASHSSMGAVVTRHAMMGLHQSVVLQVGERTDTVRYATTTRFALGRSSLIKRSAHVRVTGTLTGSTLTASRRSV